MGKNKKIDKNQPSFVAALRACNFEVFVVSYCHELGDLVVGYKDQLYFVEVKNPETSHGITSNQEKLVKYNNFYVCETPDSFIRLLRATGVKISKAIENKARKVYEQEEERRNSRRIHWRI